MSLQLRRAALVMIAAIGIGTLAISAASAQIVKSQSQDLKIGVAFPLSGPDAGLAVPVIQSIKLAVKQANAGVFGKVPGKLSVSIQDDQDKPEIGAEVARKFCSDPSIGAVIGHFASIVSIGAEPIYSRCGLAELAPTSSNDVLTQKGYKNFFRLCATNSVQTRLAARWVHTHLPAVKTVVTIDANDVTTTSLAQEFSQASGKYGGRTLSAEHITTGSTDFSGVLTKVIAEKPDLIYLSLFVNDGSLIVKQARQLGYKGPMLGIDAMDDPNFVNLAGPASEGVYITTLGLDPTRLKTGQAYSKAFRAMWHTAASSYGADAYDAVRVAVKAWQKSHSSARASIMKAIPPIKFTGILGPVAFTPTGEQKSPGIGVYQVKNGQFVFIGPA